MSEVISYQLGEHILKVLRYYHYFRYPLTLDELHFNFPVKTTPQHIDATLGDLIKDGSVFRFGPFYTMVNDIGLIERRKNGNAMAAQKMIRARKAGRIIRMFPFVQTVFISGSLSKNYADEKTDIDFFICTQPGRLWIARTLLHAFKKLTFLIGKQHDFCMNYFVDTAHLELEEKNIYTAIELATLKPVFNDDALHQVILSENNWISGLLPNIYERFGIQPERPSPVVLIRNGGIGKVMDALNALLMQVTNWHWKRKWARRRFPVSEYDLAFKTRIYVSKNHPQNYQKRMLEYCKVIGWSE